MSHLSLEEQLLNFLQAPDYQPQDVSGIARGLGLPAGERSALRSLLKEWESDGRIIRLRQARFKLRQLAPELIEGRVKTLPNGKQLLLPDEKGQQTLRASAEDGRRMELPIPKLRSMGAMDGDTVRAIVKYNTPPTYRRRHRGLRPTTEDLRPEARVVEIVRRRQGFWVGIYRPGGPYGFLKGDGHHTPDWVRLQEAPPPHLQVGMSISVEPLTYPVGKMMATGRVAEVLGWPNDEGVDMRAVIQRHGLHTDFADDVLEETRQLPGRIPAAEYTRRDDWRPHCVFTIDPETARDYDDAISVRAMEEGWELAVHIADVSYYVKPGSALDREAQQRGNSTYLPDRVLPMLPPKLCDDLCSLREGEDRLTKLCLMRISQRGKILHTSFRDAVICSRRRLTYPQAMSIIESRGSSGDEEVDAMIREAHRLAQQLRTLRFEAGALDLEMPEIRVLLDEHGVPTGVESTRSDASHELIEEFMLAANEQVAKALKARMVPAVYRVHEAPDPGKLHEFAMVARSYGITAGTLNTRDELRRVMAQFRGHPDEALIKVSLLRSMMRARYSPRALGHYGLAKGDYCHFTSPIRRYADLIIHRGFARLTGQPGSKPGLPTGSKLDAIAEHISETERISATAEQEAEHLKLVQLMELQCNTPHPIVWNALITAAWPQGLAVEITELQMKGFISGALLPRDSRWFYEKHANCWSSTDGHRLLPGHALPAVPVNVDHESGFLELRPATPEEQASAAKQQQPT